MSTEPHSQVNGSEVVQAKHGKEASPISEQDEIYSIFGVHKRRFVVFIAAAGAMFSSLSANIYFPIFDVLAEDLQVSNTLINLTVTTYMVCEISFTT